jgi:hypothetical protein
VFAVRERSNASVGTASAPQTIDGLAKGIQPQQNARGKNQQEQKRAAVCCVRIIGTAKPICHKVRNASIARSSTKQRFVVREPRIHLIQMAFQDTENGSISSQRSEKIEPV